MVSRTGLGWRLASSFAWRMAALSCALAVPVDVTAARTVPLEPSYTFGDGSQLTFSCKTVVRHRFSIRTPVKVAGVRWRCAGSRADQARPILWVHGGPFSALDTVVPTDMVRLLLDRGYEVYAPMMHGDEGTKVAMRDGAFVEDARLVLAQLKAVLASIRSRHGSATVLGESHGGYLASFLAGDMKAGEALILCSPLLLRPGDIYVRNRLGTPFSTEGMSPEKIEETTLWFRKLVTSFYGPLLDKSIGDGLENGSPASVLIMLGEEDPIIVVEELPSLRRRLGAKVEWMTFPGMKHENFNSLAAWNRFADRVDALTRAEGSAP